MRLIFFFFMLALQVSCHERTAQTSSASKEVLMQADRAFSRLSKEKGMVTAFLHYMDSNAVLLRPNLYPIAGADAQRFLKSTTDTGFTLTWEPQAADLAQSGDLGYTYGLYNFSSRDTSFQGTYVSIWKRQADGSWKYVLDTGNAGVGKK